MAADGGCWRRWEWMRRAEGRADPHGHAPTASWRSEATTLVYSSPGRARAWRARARAACVACARDVHTRRAHAAVCTLAGHAGPSHGVHAFREEGGELGRTQHGAGRSLWSRCGAAVEQPWSLPLAIPYRSLLVGAPAELSLASEDACHRVSKRGGASETNRASERGRRRATSRTTAWHATVGYDDAQGAR